MGIKWKLIYLHANKELEKCVVHAWLLSKVAR